MIRPKAFAERIVPLRGAAGQSPYPDFQAANLNEMGIAPTGVDIIDDAPEDGFTYGRRNGEWVRIVPLSGATMEGAPLLLFRDPEEPMEAVTKRYADARLRSIDGGTFNATDLSMLTRLIEKEMAEQPGRNIVHLTALLNKLNNNNGETK